MCLITFIHKHLLGGLSARQALCCVLRKSKQLGLSPEKPQGSLTWGDMVAHGSRAAAGEPAPAVPQTPALLSAEPLPRCQPGAPACLVPPAGWPELHTQCTLTPWHVSPGDPVLGGGGGWPGARKAQSPQPEPQVQEEKQHLPVLWAPGGSLLPPRWMEKLSPERKSQTHSAS